MSNEHFPSRQLTFPKKAWLYKSCRMVLVTERESRLTEEYLALHTHIWSSHLIHIVYCFNRVCGLIGSRASERHTHTLNLFFIRDQLIHTHWLVMLKKPIQHERSKRKVLLQTAINTEFNTIVQNESIWLFDGDWV